MQLIPFGPDNPNSMKKRGNIMTPYETYLQAASARSRYTASAAKKEGLRDIADIFQKEAYSEREPAGQWHQELTGAGKSRANPMPNAGNEESEWSDLYERFCLIADEEEITELTRQLGLIADMEEQRLKRLQKLMEFLEADQMSALSEISIRACRKCGQIIVSAREPQVCPSCEQAGNYFQLYCTND